MADGYGDDTADLLTRHKLTVDEYYRMVDAEILREDDRVELIDGEIIDMASIGVGHASVVTRMNRALVLACGERALVRVQDPVRLDRFNEPQPDFAVVKPRADFYATAHPSPANVLLLVEVADTSLRYDRVIKLPIYARAGIAEVWVVDLQRRMVEVYRSPVGDGFNLGSKYQAGDTLRPMLLPNVALAVKELLG